MTGLLFVLVSGGLSILTQFSKKHWQTLDQLFIVGMFAVIAGLLWRSFSEIAPENILILMAGMWSSAVLIFDIIVQVKKKFPKK